MNIQTSCSLQPYNTFSIFVKASLLIEYASEDEFRQALTIRAQRQPRKPTLHLGAGSNVLFTTDFPGTILRSLITGYELVGEDGDDVLVRVGAGMLFDDFVGEAIWHGWYGLENLSAIPGQVGASAVQNIGAYGVEVGHLIERVEGLSLRTGLPKSWEGAQCRYGYRQSIFKQELARKYAITYVTYRLHRTFRPRLDYGDVRETVVKAGLKEENLTAQQLRQVIMHIRRQKLPDPAVIGNAGSFFMNPVISEADFTRLRQKYPSIPGFPIADGNVKVSAAWLIDQCGWRGKRLKDTDAAVHDRQPLVLVNLGNAKGHSILMLCHDIQFDVHARFGILLRPEVNIIGPVGLPLDFSCV